MFEKYLVIMKVLYALDVRGPWIVVKNASEDAADPEHFVVSC